MSTATEPVVAPPPDITKDRIVVFTGGTITLMGDTLYAMTDNAIAWLTLVPLEDVEPEGAFPRERHIRIVADVMVGTVEELVEDYRKKLTTVFENLTATDSKGVIPTMGENSLRKQTAALEKFGLNRFAPDAVTVLKDHKRLPDRESQRIIMTGWQPRQDAWQRDLLMRLVAVWDGRRYHKPGEEKEEGILPPTDSPAPTLRLVQYLQTLAGDRLAKENSVASCLESLAYKTGHFTLASGASSSEYINVKNALASSLGRRIIGEHALRLLGSNKFDAVAGVIYGATPLANYIGDRLGLPVLGVRADKKGHGTDVTIEGTELLSPQANILLVEDVITSGGSLIKAAAAVLAQGFNITQVVAVCDREEGGLAKVREAMPKAQVDALCRISEIREERQKKEVK